MSSLVGVDADLHADDAQRLAEERKLVRKVDWLLLPILMITLGLQYYDKAVLGSAAVFGILEDLVCRHVAARGLGLTVGPDTDDQRQARHDAILYRLGRCEWELSFHLISD